MKNKNWLSYAGFVYVIVWTLGLLIEFGSPAPSAAQAELVAYFTTHAYSHMLQAYLIDGIAGIAILIFSAQVAQHFSTRNDEAPHIVRGAGIAAASVSLIQAGFQLALSNPDMLASDGSSLKTILVLVNQMDIFKLLALALLSGTVSALVFQTKILPVGLGWLGTVLSVSLITGGLGFVSEVPVFTYVLFVSLPLLLIWVGALNVAILRTEHIHPAFSPSASKV